MVIIIKFNESRSKMNCLQNVASSPYPLLMLDHLKKLVWGLNPCQGFILPFLAPGSKVVHFWGRKGNITHIQTLLLKVA